MIRYPRNIITCLLTLFATLLISIQSAAQGTHVFTGAEYAIFSEFALNIDPTSVWSTTRSSSPGYFSAVGDAAYEGKMQGTNFLVDGYVKYYRSTSATVSSFEFPVGQGSELRPVIISAVIPDNASFATAWFTGDPGLIIDPTDGVTHDRNSKSPGVVSVLPLGFWDWQTFAGTATGMTITVSIPDVSAYVHTSSLILLGWDGARWINLGGTAGAGPYSNNWANGNTEGA